MHLIGISVWRRCSQLSVRRVAFSVCVCVCVSFPRDKQQMAIHECRSCNQAAFHYMALRRSVQSRSSNKESEIVFFFFYFFINKIKDLLFMTQLTLYLLIHPLHGLTPDGDTLLSLHLREGGSPCWWKTPHNCSAWKGFSCGPWVRMNTVKTLSLTDSQVKTIRTRQNLHMNLNVPCTQVD